jgi:hypothetical protein
MSRSYEKITLADLRRLGEVAALDLVALFERKPELGQLYADRLFAMALCQGAALHFIDGKNGTKDLDVWSFFESVPMGRQFPPRRCAKADFGDPKFGTTEDRPNFVGRRVDLLGRSLEDVDRDDPVATLRRYLRRGQTRTAQELAQKAVVLIEPTRLLGTIVWPQD